MTGSKIDNQMNRQVDRQIEIQTLDSQADRQTGFRHTRRQTGRKIDRHVDSYTYSQLERYSYSKIDSQGDRKVCVYRQTEEKERDITEQHKNKQKDRQT